MFTTRPELVGTYGMVAFTHWLASSAGMAVLGSGGHAFDAAVAGLRARNHDVEVVDGWSLGRISAVSRDVADGSACGAASLRGMQGYAVGR